MWSTCLLFLWGTYYVGYYWFIMWSYLLCGVLLVYYVGLLIIMWGTYYVGVVLLPAVIIVHAYVHV